MLRRIVSWGVALAIGYVIARALPDAARYLKIREM